MVDIVKQLQAGIGRDRAAAAQSIIDLRSENAALRAELAAANEKHITAEARLDSVGIMLAGADKQIETLAAAAALHERNAIKAERDLAAAKALLRESGDTMRDCAPWLDQYANTAQLRSKVQKLVLRIDAAIGSKG